MIEIRKTVYGPDAPPASEERCDASGVAKVYSILRSCSLTFETV
jgi:hypothetical protein